MRSKKKNNIINTIVVSLTCNYTKLNQIKNVKLKIKKSYYGWSLIRRECLGAIPESEKYFAY